MIVIGATLDFASESQRDAAVAASAPIQQSTRVMCRDNVPRGRWTGRVCIGRLDDLFQNTAILSSRNINPLVRHSFCCCRYALHFLAKGQ